MSVTLLYNKDFDLTIYKSPKFDIDIRVHVRQVDLFDNVVETVLPFYAMYDVMNFPFRRVEHFNDAFDSSKEDTPSFFEAYESQDDHIVHSNYIAPDLKALEPISKRWNKPVGRFDSIKTIGVQQEFTLGRSRYLTLIPQDVSKFNNLYDYCRGFNVTVLHKPWEGSYIVPEDTATLLELFSDGNLLLRWERMDSVQQTPRVGCFEGINTSSDHFLQVFSCILYIPNQKEYTIKNGNLNAEFLEVYLDNVKVFSYNKDKGVMVRNTYALSQGFHRLYIYKLSRGVTTSDLRIDNTVSEVPITNSGFDSIGVVNFAVAYPQIDSTIVEYLKNLIPVINQYSLLAEQYIPVTALLTPRFSSSDFFKMNYRYIPDSLEVFNYSSLDGNVDSLWDDNTYISNSASSTDSVLVINRDDSDKLVRLQAKFKNYKPISRILVKERRYSTTDRNTSKVVLLKIWDSIGELIGTQRILDNIQQTFNILNVRAIEGGFIELLKEDENEGFEILFNSPFDVTRIELSTDLDQWRLYSLEFGTHSYPSYYIVDRVGNILDIDKLDHAEPSDYDDISFVPEVFKHDTVPADVKQGSEFIIFGLDSLVSTITIDYLGTSYDITNPDTHHNVRQPRFIIHNVYSENKYIWNFYRDSAGTQLLKWNYLGYNDSSSSLDLGDFTTLTVTITNLTGSNLSGVFILKVPHYSHAYQASVSGSNIPCVGYNRDKSYVTNYEDWDSNEIAVQTSVSANSSIQIDLTSNNIFSDTSAITQSLADINSYKVTQDRYDTSLVVTEDLTIPANATVTVYCMQDTGVTTDNTLSPPTSRVVYQEYILIDPSGFTGTKETILNVSSFRKMFGRHVPFQVLDVRTNQPVQFCYRNEQGNYTNYFSQWYGDEIVVKVPIYAEGTKLVLIPGYVECDVTNFDSPSIDDLKRDTYYYIPFDRACFDFSKQRADTECNNITLIPDQIGEAVCAGEFNHIDSYVQLNASGLNLQNDISISLWFRTTRTNVMLNYSETSSSSDALLLWIDDDGYLNFQYSESLGQSGIIKSSSTFVDNTWHHIVAVADVSGANKARLWVDNVLQNTQPTLGSINHDVHNFNFGKQHNTVDFYGGVLDEIRVFKRDLQPNEVDTLYTNFKLQYEGTGLVVLTDTPESSIIKPASVITNLLDLKSLNALPVIIYKYLDIDTILVEQVN